MVEEILKERGRDYGPFSVQAGVTDAILRFAGWEFNLPPVLQQGVYMIAVKLSRMIAGGQPKHRDSVDDIAGYAKLIVNAVPASKFAHSSAVTAEETDDAWAEAELLDLLHVHGFGSLISYRERFGVERFEDLNGFCDFCIPVFVNIRRICKDPNGAYAYAQVIAQEARKYTSEYFNHD